MESFKQLAKYYVQSLVESLNGRFPDLSFFNSAKLFSPCHYLQDVHAKEQNSKRWLEKHFEHLQHTLCEREENNASFEFEACLKELHAFVDTLRVNCEGSFMKDAWRIFCVESYIQIFQTCQSYGKQYLLFLQVQLHVREDYQDKT